MYVDFDFEYINLSEYVKTIQNNNQDLYKNFLFDKNVINVYDNKFDYFILYNVNLDNSTFKNIDLQYLKFINTNYIKKYATSKESVKYSDHQTNNYNWN